MEQTKNTEALTKDMKQCMEDFHALTSMFVAYQMQRQFFTQRVCNLIGSLVDIADSTITDLDRETHKDRSRILQELVNMKRLVEETNSKYQWSERIVGENNLLNELLATYNGNIEVTAKDFLSTHFNQNKLKTEKPLLAADVFKRIKVLKKERKVTAKRYGIRLLGLDAHGFELDRLNFGKSTEMTDMTLLNFIKKHQSKLADIVIEIVIAFTSNQKDDQPIWVTTDEKLLTERTMNRL